MTAFDWIGAGLTLLVFIYLGYALIRAEDF